MVEMASPEVYELPIEWHVPESFTSSYATNLAVQHTEHEFIISFFEVQPPLIIGSPEKVKEHLQQIRTVRANCVARVIVAAERMPEFLRVLQENLNKYLSQKAEKDDDGE